MPEVKAGPETKVPFYGHVRQYHGIQKEIDTAIRTVLESNQYVMGPALRKTWPTTSG